LTKFQTLFFYDLAQFEDTLSQAERSCSAQGKGSSHRGQQHIERVRIVMTYPVDEEGWGTAHSAMPPAFGVLVHPMRKNMGAQLPLEALGIQSKSGSIVLQVLIVERILVLEQQIMHVPKLALGGSPFRRFRSMPGMRMNLRQGKMAKDKA